VTPANRPSRPIVDSVRQWIIEEMQADIARIDLLYPQLDLAGKIAEAS